MDNLEQISQKVNTDIDPLGAPGSILAENHNDILQAFLNASGKYVGLPFVVKSNYLNVINPGELFVDGAFNAPMTMYMSPKTTDATDTQPLLELFNAGDKFHLKDFVGRSVYFTIEEILDELDSNTNQVFKISLTPFPSNTNYSYQFTEQRIGVVELIKAVVSGAPFDPGDYDLNEFNNVDGFQTEAEVDEKIALATVGLWDDRGSYDASTNVFPSTGGSGSAGAILKGDIWTISVAGTLGGEDVTPGDTVRALTDAPAVDSDWGILENNVGYVPENTVNKSLSVVTDLLSNIKFPSVKAVYDFCIDYFKRKYLGIVTVAGTTYSFLLDSQNKKFRFTSNSTITATIETNATTAIEIGTVFETTPTGDGVLNVVGAGGVTILTNLTTAPVKNETRRFVKIDTNTWTCEGGGTVDATPTVKGIAKLYAILGSNTDGAVHQSAVTTEFGNKLDKAIISESISANFNLSAKPTWNNREVNIDNGATDIQITIDVAIHCIINKIGTGIITFIQGSGRTLETMTSTDEMISQYAIARVFSIGTVDTLFINDDNDFAFIKKTNFKMGIIAFGDFTGTPRTATVTFASNFPDTNYVVDFMFGEFLTGSVRVTSQTVSGFTVAINQATALTVDVKWKALRIE